MWHHLCRIYCVITWNSQLRNGSLLYRLQWGPNKWVRLFVRVLYDMEWSWWHQRSQSRIICILQVEFSIRWDTKVWKTPWLRCSSFEGQPESWGSAQAGAVAECVSWWAQTKLEMCGRCQWRSGHIWGRVCVSWTPCRYSRHSYPAYRCNSSSTRLISVPELPISFPSTVWSTQPSKSSFSATYDWCMVFYTARVASKGFNLMTLYSHIPLWGSGSKLYSLLQRTEMVRFCMGRI